MRQELINQMYAELLDTKSCKSDFEKYDLFTLRTTTNNSRKFLWLVYEYGTVFSFIDEIEWCQITDSEIYRMQIFNDKYAPIHSILFFATYSGAKCFYYDGVKLNRIEFSEIKKVYDSVTGDSYRDLVAKYPHEFEICNAKLPIKFSSPDIEKEFNKSLKFAESLHDNSLKNIIDRFQNYRRVAVNQYIQIGYEYGEHCYTFAEIANGNCSLLGGIIYDAESGENRWSSHT